MVLTLSASASFAQPAVVDYTAKVDALIGTGGLGLEGGFVYPGATYPFGMVQFTPTYFNPRGGFVINQISGAGCPHMGNFPLLPVNGAISVSPCDVFSNRISIENERGTAGYYESDVDGDIHTELAVTSRTGMARFTYGSESKGSVVIGAGVAATIIETAAICITSPNSLEGYAEGGRFCGVRTPYKVYFVAEFDTPAAEFGVWKGEQLLKGESFAEGMGSGVYFTFDLAGGKEVNYKVGVSYVSVANARENLRAENSGWAFDEVRGASEAQWNKLLSKIEVTGSDPLRERQFYTHLYHALIHPNICCDINGEYMGADGQVHKSNITHYTSFSNWDTYRTQIQLLAMLVPDIASEIVISHQDFAEQSGGVYPRWVMANTETGIMQGDPSSALVANAWAFGAQNYEPHRQFRIMRKTATAPGAKSQKVEARPGLQQYLEKGWWNSSEQLEYCTSDFAIGRFALDACDDEFAWWEFGGRAQSWKNLYNPETNWLQSRNADGSWKRLDADWRESTYPNYYWMVPFNIKGLIDIMGGPAAAEKRLDELFVQLDANYVEDWYACGNEPSFHIPWVYNWVGRPDKTSDVLYRVLNDHYSAAPDGLPGNDDVGTMGAWYVFTCMGMYPMIPGVGGFTLNTPFFEKVVIHLPKGDININSGKGRYIKSMTLDGKPHNRAWLDWTDLKTGADINYITTDKPSAWARDILPPSFD